MKNNTKSTKQTVCALCKGVHFESDNAKRQANVRTLMQSLHIEGGLPNCCAGSMSTACLCPYQNK